MTSDALIGIKLDIETRTERLHPIAIAALSTDNLVAASDHMARYKKLTAPEEILVTGSAKPSSSSLSEIVAIRAVARSPGDDSITADQYSAQA